MSLPSTSDLEVTMGTVEEKRTDDSQATRSMASPGGTAHDQAVQETLTFSVTPALGGSATAGPSRLSSQFGRYRILKRLGSGGMGSVYLAHDTQLDRQVALKVPHFRLEDGPESIERFYREARSAATIQHPNICPVFDVGEIEGTHYLTMACIEGRPLSDYLSGGKPLPQRQVAAVVRKLALALQEAHARGVIHRDLKPSNIMIDKRREPVIMDFGLARRLGHGDTRLTHSGSIVGTPAYMSPEQVQGDLEAMGPASDVYSLGVMLYELLSGRPPFDGSVGTVLARILTEEPASLAQRRPDIDPALESICRKAMSKRLADRYAHAGEMAADLADYLHARRRPAGVEPAADGPDKSLSVAADSLLGPESLAERFFAQLDAQRQGQPILERRLLPAGNRSRARRGPWIALGAVAALAGVVLLGVVLLFPTKNGTIRIKLSDPTADVQIQVDGEAVEITGLDEPLKLAAGEHKLLVSGKGFKTVSEKFEVERNGHNVLTVDLVPLEEVRPVTAASTEPNQGAPGQPAAADDAEAVAGAPLLLTPLKGAVLDNGRIDQNDDIIWDFDWSDVPEAELYHLYVIAAKAKFPVLDRPDLTESAFHFVNPRAYIGGVNVSDWRWKVRAKVDGNWGPWSNERSFDVELPDTDPPGEKPDGASATPAPARPLANVEAGQALEIAGPLFGGGEFDLAKQFGGKVVLVDFWATWCGPCVREMPNVLAVYEKYHEHGLEIVGISLDNDPDDLKEFIEKRQVPWPQVLFPEESQVGWKNPLVAKYEVHGIPCSILVDREGKVLTVGLRGKALEPAVAAALGLPPPAAPVEGPAEPPAAQQVNGELPPPAIVLSKQEVQEQGGKKYTYVELAMTNWNAYPDSLFRPAPNLPAIGANTEASRTVAEIYTQDDKYIYGFCRYEKAEDVKTLWFAVPVGEALPKAVYVLLKDRKLNKSYKSNLLSLETSDRAADTP